VALFPLLFISFFIVFFGNKIAKYFSLVQEKISVLNDLILESIKGILLIKAYNLNDSRRHILDEQSEVVFKSNKKLIQYDSLF